MSSRALAFIVDGKSGIKIRLERNDGFDSTATTNADGYTLFDGGSPAAPWRGAAIPESPWDVNIHVSGAGYKPYDFVLGQLIPGGIPSGNHQLFIGQPARPINPPFDILLPALEPTSAPAMTLGAQGRRITVNGKVTPIVGIDAFLDYRYFLDGVDLTPFFDESRAHGVNCRRVWFEGAQVDNTVMQLDPRAPGFYDKVRAYVNAANAAGFIVFADIFVNNQYFGMGYDHAARMNDLWRGAAVISSGGNEASKNGFDRRLVPPAGMPLWTAGSEQQNGLPEVSTGATVMSFHGVRQWPTSIRDAVASPTEIYDVQHFPDIPMIFDEMVKMGTIEASDRCNDPAVCGRFGRHWGAEVAGAVYHNWHAQRGQLLDDGDKRCLDAFVKGMGL